MQDGWMDGKGGWMDGWEGRRGEPRKGDEAQKETCEWVSCSSWSPVQRVALDHPLVLWDYDTHPRLFTLVGRRRPPRSVRW